MDRYSPSFFLPSSSALCKYGSVAEEVGEGSDDWRLGTIFPRYFLPEKKDISSMEFFNNGSGRGWETDTCPIVSKIVLPLPTKFGNFCAAHRHKQILHLPTDNEKWGQRGFKIVTVSSQQIGGGAVRLNMENKAFTSPRFPVSRLQCKA